MNASDKAVVRSLAAEVAAVAALSVQDEKRRLWRKLNGLHPERPMVMVDQVCWNEMNVGDELTLLCEDPECRGYEDFLRRTLFQWRHFPVDMVVDSFIRVPKAILNSGWGVAVHETVAVSDPTSAVLGHAYANQFETEEDLEKLRQPVLCHDEEETRRRLEVAHELFDGLLEVREEGIDPYLSLWDPIATWMGVENALYKIADEPEYMHRLVGKLTDGYLAILDQIEREGWVCGPQSLIHCTGAWTEELTDAPRWKDRWMFGLAQMFSTVSPAMFEEYEVDYASRICERFGLVYYGCCDPLDGKMNEVRKIPNVRKVSMSPWVDVERGACAIGGDFVFSRKPSPAFLAWDSFDPQAVREDLLATIRACERSGSPLEIILKDISTVRYDPERLFEWSRIAMDLVTA